MSVQILSVLDKLRRDRRPDTRTEEEEKGPDVILDKQELDDILDREMERRRLDDDRAAKCANYRTWIRDWRAPYDGLIDNVDEPGFVSIIDAALKGQLDTIRNQQPNGDWRVMGYERSVAKLDRVTYLRVGVLWVDVLGKEDLTYIDGKPSSGVKVNVQTQSLPPEVIEALTRNNNGGMPPEMMAFLAAQARLMNAQAEALEKPVAEEPVVQEPPRRGPGRPPKILGDALNKDGG